MGRRVRGAKVARNPQLARYIADRLAAAWSPEQIAGYVRRHRLAGLSICHETIYQYVYGEGRSQGLWRHLPCARRSRRQRYARKPRGVHIPMANTIKARPAEIGHRSEEHTSELQSLMRISYAVFCLKKKKQTLKNMYSTNPTI